MATPVIVQQGYAASTPTTTQVVTLGAAPTAGNLLIAFYVAYGSSMNNSHINTGAWTIQQGHVTALSNGMYILSRIADGTETATLPNFTDSTASTYYASSVYEISGGTFDQAQLFTSSGGTLNTTAVDALALSGNIIDGALSAGYSSPWTQDIHQAHASGYAISAAHQAIAVSGNPATISSTNPTGSGANGIVLLNVASGGGDGDGGDGDGGGGGGTPVFFGASGDGGFSYGTASSTVYQFVGMSGLSLANITTEANAALVWRTAGVMSFFGVTISANARSSTTTFRDRKNSANGGMSVSVGAGSTGHFQDSTHTTTIASGDTYCSAMTTGASGGAIVLRTIELVFNADSNNAMQPCFTARAGTYGASSGSWFQPLWGQAGSTAANSSETRTADEVFRINGTLSNLFARVTANPKTSTVTLNSRKNTTNQNQTLSISGGATGNFEDTTNTDTLTAGDIWKVTGSATADSGFPSIIFSHFSMKIAPSASGFEIGCALSSLAGFITTNVTNFYPLNGPCWSQTTEANVKMTVPVTLTCSRLRCVMANNLATNTVTLSASINGSPGSQSVSITNGVTGQFEDTTHTDLITAGDAVSFSHTGPNNATWGAQNITMTADPGGGSGGGGGAGSGNVQIVIGGG